MLPAPLIHLGGTRGGLSFGTILYTCRVMIGKAYSRQSREKEGARASWEYDTPPSSISENNDVVDSLGNRKIRREQRDGEQVWGVSVSCQEMIQDKY